MKTLILGAVAYEAPHNPMLDAAAVFQPGGPALSEATQRRIDEAIQAIVGAGLALAAGQGLAAVRMAPVGEG